MRVGFIIHGLTYFKPLASLINMANIDPRFKPIIFYFNGKYVKTYDVANPNKFPDSLKGILRVPFNNYSNLTSLSKKHKIDCIVGIELGAKIPHLLDFFNKSRIKTCSIQLFTDGIWEGCSNLASLNKISLICYQGRHMFNFHNKILGRTNVKNCIIAGNPFSDSIKKITRKHIKKYNLPSKYVLLMLPNHREHHYKKSFGGVDNFIRIISELYGVSKKLNIPMVAKSRVKQWHPP